MVIIYFVILVSMRAFTALLLILFSLLQYRLWFGKNSVPDYYALQDEVTRQQSTNEKLKQLLNLPKPYEDEMLPSLFGSA